MTVFTIGHSTHDPDTFLRLLAAFQVRAIADIRTVPKSRRNPQYGIDLLPEWLGAANVLYVHMRDLGGLRKPLKDSVNVGWRNDSFRGYADYMQTPQFTAALGELIAAAGARRTAMMCAESVPWRCHRSLVADALTVRGIEVRHIMTERSAKPHVLTPWALVEGTRVTYPALSEADDSECGGTGERV